MGNDPNGGRQPLIERDEQLDALSRLAEHVLDGGARLVLITGEAGIGKSRLCQEFLRTLSPHWVSSEVSGYQRLPGTAFHGLLDEPGRAASSPSELAGRLVEAMAKRSDGARPFVLLVEDLQWMDADAATVLRETVVAAREFSLLVLATFRSGSHPLGTPVQRAVAELARDHRVSELRLAPLSAGGVAELATASSPDWSPDLLDSLYERTAGVPFLVEELLAADNVSLPWTIKEFVQGRVESLGQDATDVLAMLAVARRPLALDVVRAVGSHLLQAPLTALVDAFFASASDERVQLRHALVGEVTEEILDDDARRHAHLALAQALESVDPDAHDVIADHWLEAGEYELAARHVPTPSIPPPEGTVAPGALAPDSYSAGVQYELMAVAEAAKDNIAVGLAWARAAERCYLAAGDHARAEALWADTGPVRSVGAMREWLANRGSGSIHELSEQARALLKSGDVNDARTLGREMVRQLGPQSPGGSRLLCADVLGACGDLDAAEAVITDWEHYARQRGLHDDLARSAARRAWLAFGRGHTGQAMAMMRHASTEAHRDPGDMLWRGLDPILAVVLAACGEITDARDIAEPLLDEEPFGIFANVPMAAVDLELGDFTQAQQRLEAVLPVIEVLAAGDEVSAYAMAMTVHAAVEFNAGRVDEAIAIADRTLTVDRDMYSPTLPDLLMIIARASLALGDRERASEVAATLHDHARTATGPGVQGAASFADGLLAAHDDRAAEARRAFAAAARAFEHAPRWTHAADAWCMAAEMAIRLDEDPGHEIEAAAALCSIYGLHRLENRVSNVAAVAGANSEPKLPPALRGLTPRELEVSRLVATGCTNREIGQKLFLAEGTVRNYLSRVYDKVGVSRRVELVRIFSEVDKEPTQRPPLHSQ